MFLGMSDGGSHDGDEGLVDEDADGEVDLGAGEKGWREVTVETVECEVPSDSVARKHCMQA